MTTASSASSHPVHVPDGEVPADVYLPASGTGPGIVLFQEIFGVTDYIRGRAGDLADLGYVVLVPHVYWRVGDEVVSEAADGLPRAMELLGKVDWEAAVSDGVAALSALRDHPAVDGPVGLLGFCFGGGLAFNVAAVAATAGAGPDALVSYYGSALPTLLGLAPQVDAPSLHHFGLDDDYIPVDTVREIEAAVTATNDDVTFVTHEGAGHAFDNPSPVFHHAGASQEAWAATTAWLAAKLPV
ncbi:carboxymethylenebutenolidase [Pedococcus dokdonensis]|uniref:Carboxymethylenebutenolidase n=1 Tax=Pedococcus dokdonensis TaxID=443156 RepID=A0A1H0NV16_9MICO|nr:dienelactone hydrolase family protein [Pedococcus dokdonensis]SDO96358.1 carboxymethylenebutenolidase [Pedococcus dokdonensis]